MTMRSVDFMRQHDAQVLTHRYQTPRLGFLNDHKT